MNKYKILLVNIINPKMKDETCFPHLGLGYLAACIEKELPGQFEIKIVDSNILQETINFNPRIVGITTTSQYYKKAVEFTNNIQYLKPLIIIGGAHISALPMTLSENINFGVIGEGEVTIVEFLKSWLNKELDYVDKIDGLTFAGRVTKPREMIQNLDDLPMPNRDLMKIGKSTSMFTSRGCPYKCVYCFSSRFWSKVRLFSAEYVVNEIKTLYEKYKVNDISLLDDLFIVDKHRVGKIVELLDKEKLLGKISYVCNVRSNLVTSEMALMLSELGVRTVGMGIESACPETLEFLKGKENIDIEDHKLAIDILRKFKIHVHPSFIIGSPNETLGDIIQTYKFIEQNKINDYEVYVLNPIPGTPIWKYAKNRGLVVEDENWEWDRLYWNFEKNKCPVILSETLNEDEIRKLHQMFRDRKQKYFLKELINSGIKRPDRIFPYLKERFIK